VKRTSVKSVKQPTPVNGPAHWAADVILRDGRPCHVRPIRPDDGPRLRAFHASLSAETVYLRFFAPYPQLTDADVERFTIVDYVDRVALVATVGEDIIGVGRYDRMGADHAEVAFTIRDDHQGRGLGSVLLEHLAAAARERGIVRFVADVLPQNRRMQATFEAAGFHTAREFTDGYLVLEFDIEPTKAIREVMEARERVSEARSIRRMLTPHSVAVIGASRTQGTAGHELLRHLRDAGFPGDVYAVHPEAESILGFPCIAHITDAPAPVDLAIVAVRAEVVLEVIDECAKARVRGLVVVGTGFAETGIPQDVARQRELVNRSTGQGMRVVGPAALGMMNTDPHTLLNASLSPVMPARGRLGFFCQSGGLGSVILADMVERGLGLSTFVSAGNRSDVSGNDLLQFWDEDEATDAVLLYLESVGNPRKFTRIVRKLARRKPVIAVRSGRTSQSVPLGHRVRTTELPSAAVDALFDQCGVIQTDSVRAMLDVAALVSMQPEPTSSEVAVITTAQSLAVLAEDAVLAAGLNVGTAGAIVSLPLSAAELSAAILAAGATTTTGSVLVVHVPPLSGDIEPFRQALADAVPHLSRPVVAVSLAIAGDEVMKPGWHATVHGPWIGGIEGAGVSSPGAVPLFGTVEEAVKALASVEGHSRWKRVHQVEPRRLDDDAQERALAYCARILGDSAERVTVAAKDAGELFVALGLAPVTALSHVDTESSVACRVRVLTDPLFGPVIAFGLAGDIPELLADVAYASAPLTEGEAADLARTPKAAPLLTGEHGGSRVDMAAIEEFLLAVAAAADAVALLEGLDLTVLAHRSGLSIVDGAVVVGTAANVASSDRRTM